MASCGRLHQKKKVIVAYFSHSGNTRVIADQIHEIVGGEIFEIQSVDPYPSKYDDVVEQAREELREAYMPKLKTTVERMDVYNVVFLGYPNWWGTIPRLMVVFLSTYNLLEKPFYRFVPTREAALEEVYQISRNSAPNQRS